MTKEQIIEEIWKLGLWDTVCIAAKDDFIVLCKAWWIILLILVGSAYLITKTKN